MATVSVVIPTLDAGASLGECLQCLGEDVEIVIVDGGSRDDTIAIAEAAGARLVAAPRGRGSQLKAGAEAAAGDWLLFLHADTKLERGWREAVVAHVARSPAPACFRFRLDDSAWQARVLENGVALRTRLLGLPYGDQGLLISRRLYEAAGGYRPLPLMEDVDLVRRIPRVRVLDVEALTSAARWRRNGWFRRSASNLGLLALYRVGVAPDRLARLYR